MQRSTSGACQSRASTTATCTEFEDTLYLTDEAVRAPGTSTHTACVRLDLFCLFVDETGATGSSLICFHLSDEPKTTQICRAYVHPWMYLHTQMT